MWHRDKLEGPDALSCTQFYAKLSVGLTQGLLLCFAVDLARLVEDLIHVYPSSASSRLSLSTYKTQQAFVYSAGDCSTVRGECSSLMAVFSASLIAQVYAILTQLQTLRC